MAKFEVAALRAAGNIRTISSNLVRLIEQIVQRLSLENEASSNGQDEGAARSDLVCALELQKQIIDEYLVLLRSMPVESSPGFPRRRGPVPKSTDATQSQEASKESPAQAEVPASRVADEQLLASAPVRESEDINEHSQPIEDSFDRSAISCESAPLTEELSQREREIVALVARGYDNKEIGESLRLSPQTVKNHMRAIYAKTGVSCREELLPYAKNAGGNRYPRSLREADLLGDVSSADSN